MVLISKASHQGLICKLSIAKANIATFYGRADQEDEQLRLAWDPPFLGTDIFSLYLNLHLEKRILRRKKET